MKVIVRMSPGFAPGIEVVGTHTTIWPSFEVAQPLVEEPTVSVTVLGPNVGVPATVGTVVAVDIGVSVGAEVLTPVGVSETGG